MIHRFISNDNKGNVNTFEIGSTYTKISKITTPVNDEDAANKKYVDDHAGSGGGVLIVTESLDGETGKYVLNKTWQEIYDAGFAVLKDPDAMQTISMLLCQGYPDDDEYVVSFVGVSGGVLSFACEDPTDYPWRANEEEPSAPK